MHQVRIGDAGRREEGEHHLLRCCSGLQRLQWLAQQAAAAVAISERTCETMCETLRWSARGRDVALSFMVWVELQVGLLDGQGVLRGPSEATQERLGAWAAARR